MTLNLTHEEKEILKGREGKAKAKAMKILVTLGEIFGAQRLIPVSSVQISGVSYKTIGDAGIEFIKDLSEEAKVVVESFLNPIGMDEQRWQEMGFSPQFAEKQHLILKYYKRMGIKPTLTCTPYYIKPPKFGEHLAWGESSAVIYVNSVVGARTNREGGPSALASALIGKTPEYGFHLEKNRRPTFLVKVKIDQEEMGEDAPLFYPLLGKITGEKLKSEVPLFKGIVPDRDEMKSLGAAMAASGAVALYHIHDHTPEAIAHHYHEDEIPEKKRIEVNWEDIKIEVERYKKSLREMVRKKGKKPILIAVGCPHLSEKELKKAASLLSGLEKKKLEKHFRLWLFTSRYLKEKCRREVEIIEKSGAKVFADTCMVVSPIEEHYEFTVTNSGKALVYLPKMCKQRVSLNSLESVIGEVMK